MFLCTGFEMVPFEIYKKINKSNVCYFVKYVYIPKRIIPTTCFLQYFIFIFNWSTAHPPVAHTKNKMSVHFAHTSHYDWVPACHRRHAWVSVVEHLWCHAYIMVELRFELLIPCCHEWFSDHTRANEDIRQNDAMCLYENRKWWIHLWQQRQLEGSPDMSIALSDYREILNTHKIHTFRQMFGDVVRHVPFVEFAINTTSRHLNGHQSFSFPFSLSFFYPRGHVHMPNAPY